MYVDVQPRTLTLAHAGTPNATDGVNAVIVITVHKTQLNLLKKKRVMI